MRSIILATVAVLLKLRHIVTLIPVQSQQMHTPQRPVCPSAPRSPQVLERINAGLEVPHSLVPVRVRGTSVDEVNNCCRERKVYGSNGYLTLPLSDYALGNDNPSNLMSSGQGSRKSTHQSVVLFIDMHQPRYLSCGVTAYFHVLIEV